VAIFLKRNIGLNSNSLKKFSDKKTFDIERGLVIKFNAIIIDIF